MRHSMVTGFVISVMCVLQWADARPAVEILTGKRIADARLQNPAPAKPAVLGNVQYKITQKWNGSGWENYQRTIYTFDAMFRCIKQEVDNWDAGVWKDYKNSDTIYKTTGSVYTIFSGLADSGLTTIMESGSGWLDLQAFSFKFSSVSYTLDYLQRDNLKYLGVTSLFGDGLHDSTSERDQFNRISSYLDTATIKSLNLGIDTTGKLVNDYKIYLGRDNRNRINLQRVWVWDLLTDTSAYQWWLAVEHRYTLSNPGGNRLSWTVVYKEDYLSDTWTNYKRETYHYTLFDKQDTLTEWLWFDSTWVLQQRVVTAYNAKQMITAELTAAPMDTLWVNIDKVTYTYDDTDTNLVKKLAQSWYDDGTTSGWVNSEQELYYYTAMAVKGKRLARDNGSMALVCTATPRGTAISFHLAGPSKVTLAVYDLKGKLVRCLVDEALLSGANSILWDGKNGRGVPMPAAASIVTLKSGNGSWSRPIITAE